MDVEGTDAGGGDNDCDDSWVTGLEYHLPKISGKIQCFQLSPSTFVYC